MGYSVVLFLNRCSSSRSQAALGTAAASPHLTEYGLPLALLSVAARSMKLSVRDHALLQQVLVLLIQMTRCTLRRVPRAVALELAA
jgi:hypothetical protein